MLIRGLYLKRILVKPTVRVFILVHEHIYHGDEERGDGFYEDSLNSTQMDVLIDRSSAQKSWELHELTCDVGIRSGIVETVQAPTPYLPFPFVINVPVTKENNGILYRYLFGTRRTKDFELIAIVEYGLIKITN